MLAPILEGPVHGQTPCLGVCVEAAYPGKECGKGNRPTER